MLFRFLGPSRCRPLVVGRPNIIDIDSGCRCAHIWNLSNPHNHADLDRMQMWCDGGLVADHERAWARHQTITELAHVRVGQMLRQQRFALVQPAAGAEVEQRSVADYDTALGVAGFDEPVAL